MCSFGQFIHDVRTSIPYSSPDLGKLAGCSASFITGIEREAQFPSKTMACKILNALKIDYEELDPFTLRIKNGEIFRFKFSGRGRGSKKRPKERPEEKSRVDILEERISILEARISVLEKG